MYMCVYDIYYRYTHVFKFVAMFIFILIRIFI